jgi:hypothetical protein
MRPGHRFWRSRFQSFGIGRLESWRAASESNRDLQITKRSKDSRIQCPHVELQGAAGDLLEARGNGITVGGIAMPRRDSTPVLLLLFLSGCSMPAGMNKDCEWPIGATHAVRDRLVADVRIAEELAMRYADTNFDSKASHGRLRSGCEAKLFAVVTHNQRVALSDIEEARRQLDANAWDAPVHLPLIAFYVAVALILARKVPIRFPRDETVPAAMATLFLSLVLAGVLQALGHLWDGTVEMIRLGTTHLSYRVARLGWREYSEEVFALSVVFFWCAVVLSYGAVGRNEHREKRAAL